MFAKLPVYGLPVHKKLNRIYFLSSNGVAGTHIKGRLLDQAVILFNYVPFQNGNFS